MFKKLFIITTACLGCILFPMNVNAQENTNNADVPADEIVESLGLIRYYSLSCSVGNKIIHINMKTEGTGTMDEIGFTDIQIQRYTTSGWYTEKSISSVTITNASSYYLSDYTTSVLGGYSYRVVLNHYARDGSLYEKEGDTSNSVWIS